LARDQGKLGPEELFQALYWASAEGDVAIIDALLAHGADVNGSMPYGLTPLLIAVENQNLDAIEYLLDQGADVNRTDSHDGATALHQVVNGEIQVAISRSDRAGQRIEASSASTELLLTRGADPTIEAHLPSLPGTALDWAVRSGHKAAEGLIRANLARRRLYHHSTLRLRLPRSHARRQIRR
jgi:ankyrin repeat protein